MQRMDSFDSSKAKIFFQKRAHRPWNTVFLENTSEGSATLEEDETKLNLQNVLEEKTKERNEIHEQLNVGEENRLFIGGFLQPQNFFFQNEAEKINNTNHLMNELKNKEQEILSLANDLKVSKALEQVENLEMSRKKEEEARKSAENKALFAIQEARVAAEQTYKIEQQLHIERQSRVKDEKSKKTLEEKNKFILQEIEKKEQLLLQTKKNLVDALGLEQRIKAEAEDKVKKIVAGMSDQVEKYRQISEEAKKQASEKTAAAQEEAQKKIQHYEEMEASVQNWAQKNLDAVRQANVAKKEIEDKLENFEKTTADEEAKLKAKIQDLLEEAQQKEQQKTSIENEKSVVEKNLFQSTVTLKTMRSIIENERTLRKILEEKLKKAFDQTKELEVTLGSEKYLRKEAERLKSLEEQARKAAQEKISLTIEEANRTVLNALSGLTVTVEAPNDDV